MREGCYTDLAASQSDHKIVCQFFSQRRRNIKTNQTCPKCNSKEIVQLAGQSFGDKVYPAGGQYSTVVKYACTDCGYVETYLANPDELEALKKSPKGLDR